MEQDFLSKQKIQFGDDENFEDNYENFMNQQNNPFSEEDFQPMNQNLYYNNLYAIQDNQFYDQQHDSFANNYNNHQQLQQDQVNGNGIFENNNIQQNQQTTFENLQMQNSNGLNENNLYQISSNQQLSNREKESAAEKAQRIKNNVQIRKQKIQQMKLEQQKQQNELVEAQNMQDSQSTDIEKMVEESQEKESSNSQEVSKKGKKRITKNKEKENIQIKEPQSDSEDGLDKKTAQKIKNRISAQRSRDQKKQELNDLKKEVKELNNIIEQQNKQISYLKSQQMCQKCYSSISVSTDDSEGEQDYIRTGSPSYYNSIRSNSSLMVVLVIAIFTISMYSNNIQNFQNGYTPQIAMYELGQKPNDYFQENIQSNIIDNRKYKETQILNSNGIASNAIQHGQIVQNTKLLQSFGKPNRDNTELINQCEKYKSDQIMCGEAHIVLYDKQPHQENLLTIQIPQNSTNFYEEHKGTLYPLNNDGQNIIKITCQVLKYEQIAVSPADL